MKKTALIKNKKIIVRLFLVLAVLIVLIYSLIHMSESQLPIKTM